MTDQPDVTRDDWGFSDADHAELHTLMQRHADRLPKLLLALHTSGVTPAPDDPGMMGWLARAVPDGTTRVFPKGGLWWALLEALRAVDDDLPF